MSNTWKTFHGNSKLWFEDDRALKSGTGNAQPVWGVRRCLLGIEHPNSRYLADIELPNLRYLADLKSPVYREVGYIRIRCSLQSADFLCPKLSELTHYLMVSESYRVIMEAFAKKKGKVGTRGAGQIIKENDESLIFYRFFFCTTLFAWWSILIFQIIRVICGLSGTWYLAPMAFTSWPWPSWAEVMQPLTLPCSSSVPSVILDAFSSWGENVPLLLKIPNWLSIKFLNGTTMNRKICILSLMTDVHCSTGIDQVHGKTSNDIRWNSNRPRHRPEHGRGIGRQREGHDHLDGGQPGLLSPLQLALASPTPGAPESLLHALDQCHSTLDIPAGRGRWWGGREIVITIYIFAQVSDKKKRKQERQMKRQMR